MLSSSGNILSPLREIAQTEHFRQEEMAESDRENWDLNEWENTSDDPCLHESFQLQADRLEFRGMQ